MIEEEDSTFRVIVILLNSLSFTFTIFMLLFICTIKQLHERQGHTIQIVLILECMYSFFLILSQFYFDETDVYETTFLVSTDGAGCLTIGILNVFTSFAYFTNINLYSLESVGILSSRFTKNYKIRHLAVVSGSTFFAFLALLSKAIGFNKIGMCSLLPGNLFTVFLLILTSVTFIIIVWTCTQIHRLRKVLGKDLTSHIQEKKYNVNLIYIITFLIIRILPVLVLTIISLADSDTQTYTAAFYVLAIPMSLGGVCLSLIRSQEPTIQDYLNRRMQRQKSGIVELSLPKVEVRALSDTISNLSTESQIIKTHYFSYLQGTTRDNSVAYRKTCLDNEELVAKLTSQMENNQTKLKLSEFLLVFKIIREMNVDVVVPSITSILTHYHMKHMRQRILYFDSDASLNASEIVCTSYSESVFLQIQSIDSFMTSFDEQSNKVFVESLHNSRLKLQTNILTTYDGEVLISIINNQAKRYLTRHLLSAIYNLSTQASRSFIPPMIGLYSIVNESNQYSILIQRNLLNAIMLEQQGFKIQGFFTYQLGQVDEEIKGGNDIYAKIKMNPKVKQEFLNTLNQDLAILRDQFLWGYSFNVIYLEGEEKTNILPNMYKTRNGYAIASLGGVLDQFWISHNESSAHPELYASQLAQQIDLLL
ncbi:unnamed protein product (macronuclear) [Paramecium tetraurelia]|uniref:Uncharacterized protein n=1 Tax=Paramecium tetraurelia TaxID=5888 RepID=A0C2I0_PARTE|nr:uncharacterized protein GSPATT00034475001 [Paramecium tetraurelia]CAK64997.1 unnamed protein product [Paramecium tetraurelia]|eukprot:XP_001432394.1 hypothetical protein (macronuclear) [Paramecium tetraurelia strain d4-2]